MITKDSFDYKIMRTKHDLQDLLSCQIYDPLLE